MKKAIVFGAGNIGRGLNAFILNKNNYHVTFLDVSKKIINKIKNHTKYFIHALESDKKTIIENFDGINIIDEENKAISEIVNAEVIFISIGINNLSKIAPLLKKAILERAKSNLKHNLNIVAVENGIEASSQLKNIVENLFDNKEKETSFKNISFSNCAVDRIVPQQENENLNVDVEDFYELVIDQNSWLGKPLLFVKYSNEIKKYILRKLFMLNGTHTFIAWNGIKNNFQFINQYPDYSQIVNDVKKLLEEYSNILIQKYNFKKDDMDIYKSKIIKRLSSQKIFDDVTRVGRSVIRKISINERFIFPLKIAVENNLNYCIILKAISIPFSNFEFNDPENNLLQKEIKEKGLAFTLKKYINESKNIQNIILNYIKKI